MHIFIIASYAPSLIIFRGPLIEEMIARGHRVTACAPDIDSATHQQIEALGAEPCEVPLNRNGTGMLSDLAYLKKLHASMGKAKPDLVLTYTAKPNIWGAFAAALRSVPSASMVTGLGYAFTDSGERSAVQQLISAVVKRLYRKSTALNQTVFFQNADDRDDFIAAGCLSSRDKVVMINGSGVDVSSFRPSPLPSQNTFTMVARLLKNKGVREFAEASIRLKSRHPEARFVLVGPFDGGPDGINPADLETWEAAGLEYMGPLKDVRPVLAETRIYILPSYREGTPRSVLEAMACGRAIVTTDAPGCRETVQHGKNGFLVAVRDADALEKAMTKFITNPKIAEAFGRCSRDIATEKYAVEKVNADIINALQL